MQEAHHRVDPLTAEPLDPVGRPDPVGRAAPAGGSGRSIVPGRPAPQDRVADSAHAERREQVDVVRARVMTGQCELVACPVADAQVRAFRTGPDLGRDPGLLRQAAHRSEPTFRNHVSAWPTTWSML